jgi:hypothetical protein
LEAFQTTTRKYNKIRTFWILDAGDDLLRGRARAIGIIYFRNVDAPSPQL